MKTRRPTLNSEHKSDSECPETFKMDGHYCCDTDLCWRERVIGCGCDDFNRVLVASAGANNIR